jgi:hypothetical protein
MNSGLHRKVNAGHAAMAFRRSPEEKDDLGIESHELNLFDFKRFPEFH